MITHLKIERFKSIRQLELPCRRVNVFIGDPNTGKSNILEALGFVSWCAGNGELSALVRVTSTQYLFYDGLTDEPVRIAFQGEPEGDLSLKLSDQAFEVLRQTSRTQVTRIGWLPYLGTGQQPRVEEWRPIKVYKFQSAGGFPSGEPGPLLPPHGPNLFSVVYGSKALRQWAQELVKPFGLLLVFKPHERTFEVQKHQEGVVISYPYFLVSDTLQRMLFFHTAMQSNQNAVLVFEEPEAHAFPYYTRHLGERIALDPTNQYFLATHNPYLLRAIVEKAPKDEVAVFATRYRDYATEAHLLNQAQLERLLEADPFFELEGVLEES